MQSLYLNEILHFCLLFIFASLLPGGHHWLFHFFIGSARVVHHWGFVGDAACVIGGFSILRYGLWC